MRKIILLIFISIINTPLLANEIKNDNECIPPLTYIPLNGEDVGLDSNNIPALGSYERISPDGRFILRSFSGAKLGQVSLIELSEDNKKIKVYKTPLSNESFPVQNTWRYLVNINGAHYRFSEILEKQEKAKPLFKAGMTGFYAAASEMQDKSRDNNEIIIRSLSWPQGNNSTGQGIGALKIKTVLIKDDGENASVINSGRAEFICDNKNAPDGNIYALPMISINGEEFAAIAQNPKKGEPSMKVYSLSEKAFDNQHKCEPKADIGYSPAKAVFGYKNDENPPALTYSDIGYVYFFKRELGASFALDSQKDETLASAFPALTKDGRIIFAATWKDCWDKDAGKNQDCKKEAGYVISDPYQSSSWQKYWKARGEAFSQIHPKSCITHGQVRAQRREFATFHHLSDF